MNIVGQGSILWVSDFTLMRDFYENTLGLLPAQGDPVEGWMPFQVGSGTFALHAIPAAYQDDAEPEGSSIRWDSPTKHVFYVSDLSAAMTHLNACGVTRAPGDQLGEGYADFVDPEGNVFQIAAI